MPASRPHARSALAPYHTMAAAGSQNLGAPFVPLSPAHCSGDGAPAPSSPSVKKRRTPNAFFLFRSYMIANKLYPPELKHQNDVSCYAAEKWRAAPLEYRAVFFRMAEEKKQRNEVEGSTDRKATGKKTMKEKQRRTVGSQQESLQASFQSHESDVNCHACMTPQGLPVPVLNSFTLSDHAPVFHAAPQPIHPIPSSLLRWGCESNEQDHGSTDSGSSSYDSPPALLDWWPSVASTSCQDDVSWLLALDSPGQQVQSFLHLGEMDMMRPMDDGHGFIPAFPAYDLSSPARVFL